VTRRLLAVAIGMHVGCAVAAAPFHVPAKQAVEFRAYPRIVFCPGTVEVLVRVYEGGEWWECVAENFSWGDGDRSWHASCDPGDRALRVYSGRHIYRKAGGYELQVRFTGVRAGETKVLFKDHVVIDVRGGLAC